MNNGTRSREAVTAVVVETLKGVDTADGPVGDVDETTELLGRLDSMGLVTFVIDLEERLQDDLGIAVALATDRALSQRQSPFRNVSTLTDYVLELVAESADDGRA
jgi:acyl carrier protein